jgi:TatA/E family protein of Tat protein translocase
MFGTLGGPELFLILVIALIVFGPKKLPEIGKSLGKMMVEFRRASNDFKRTIEDEVEADKLRELTSPPRVDRPAAPVTDAAAAASAAPPGTVAQQPPAAEAAPADAAPAAPAAPAASAETER